MTFEEWEQKYIEQNTARSPLCPDYSYQDMQAAWLASRTAALEENELKLKTALEALIAIRDSTFRSSITLRSIADSAIQNIGNN